jgi:hypothetical protein
VVENKEKWEQLAYVAGPYSASSEYLISQNIEKAKQISIELWSFGWAVVCPHLNTARFGGAYGLPDEVWLKGDLTIIKRCDIVVVIPGWRFSNGTKHEIEVAKQAGIPVYFWENDKDRIFLMNYFENWRKV